MYDDGANAEYTFIIFTYVYLYISLDPPSEIRMHFNALHNNNMKNRNVISQRSLYVYVYTTYVCTLMYI